MRESKNLYNQRTEVDYRKTRGENPGTYTMKIILTNFLGARIENCADENGHIEEGVFIPLDKNDLTKNYKGDVNAYAFVNKIQFPDKKYDWTHLIRMKARTPFIEKMKELGYKTPYLGNLRLTSNAHNYAAVKSYIKYQKHVDEYGDTIK